jgi:RIP metalloprotease RseP
MIAKLTYSTAESSWGHLFLFLGMISMNLAVLNVLPVPLLDGGQLALITAEKLRGRPLPERVVEGIQWTGLALLLSFTLFVIVNDIRSF